MRANRLRFHGWIAGLGTASGTRLVLGHWPRSPLGSFSDVMAEHPDGHRVLLAPSARIAEFVSATYRFDEVRTQPVTVLRTEADWSVDAGPLRLRFTPGARTALGALLRAVPPALAANTTWTALCDLPARLLLPGVRTRGSAGGGRREWYAARDVHRITAARASWDGRDLGPLRPVVPPVRFGFGSAPPRPALTRILTTVEAAGTAAVPDTDPAGPGRM
ncbi:hypothetical protein [Streptomyces sp. SCSIO ZS0520]|uniref:hypothetical protein n=1 Tax=Streptomyces sp. SCSIO ZS0520 TaxID=2892996 RepID=UPI0021D8BE1F|nr:hypothetical protein [Streptomyces sp. SCSIO ZS0520]